MLELGDEYFMQQALKLAQQAFEEDEVPIGAVVVWNQRIIGKGYNQTEKLNDVTAHAEMIALTAAFESMGGKYLDECTLYVTIEPCSMCAGALGWARPSRIVYGASEPKFGFSRYQPSLLHKKTHATGGILKDECAELMQRFFRNKRQ